MVLRALLSFLRRWHAAGKVGPWEAPGEIWIESATLGGSIRRPSAAPETRVLERKG